ncbi:XRE family transcriptional regulator [uncultured Megasphaera sp.]|jgi:hypothetical protein|uniref:XRE family transcriptional regulator n=1 Tax=uncultured Megasphaera sp. TaxID=165188 RepID=UPI00259134A5|nr:XRE family transcriptional regulator [uncultured Megasphaera sp.]
MAVSYKKRLHRIIEKDIFNQDVMRMSNISTNIITKLRTGQYIIRESGKHLYGFTLHANDILECITEDEK